MHYRHLGPSVNTLLQLDAEELAQVKGASIDFGRPPPAPAQPQLDRDVRLRAIMRLNARRKMEPAADSPTAEKASSRSGRTGGKKRAGAQNRTRK